MNREDFEQLARNLESSEEFVHAIAHLLEIEGSDVTEENIMEIWDDPTITQLKLIKKQAVFFAILGGLKNGDKLYWGDESFVISVTDSLLYAYPSRGIYL